MVCAGFLIFCLCASPLQHCHNYLTEQLGIPVWGSYVIFALATLFSGLVLGLVSSLLKAPTHTYANARAHTHTEISHSCMHIYTEWFTYAGSHTHRWLNLDHVREYVCVWQRGMLVTRFLFPVKERNSHTWSLLCSAKKSNMSSSVQRTSVSFKRSVFYNLF